jgi:hypothetical protein
MIREIRNDLDLNYLNTADDMEIRRCHYNARARLRSFIEVSPVILYAFEMMGFNFCFVCVLESEPIHLRYSRAPRKLFESSWRHRPFYHIQNTHDTEAPKQAVERMERLERS